MRSNLIGNVISQGGKREGRGGGDGESEGLRRREREASEVFLKRCFTFHSSEGFKDSSISVFFIFIILY